MRKVYALAISCLTIVMQLCAQTTIPCRVRVLLEEGDVTQGGQWRFTTKKKRFVCVFSQGELFCNGTKIDKGALRIRSADNTCMYRECTYAGDLSFIVVDTHFYIVNHVPLEEYVYSVLRFEGWPGWPLEVNKVFAVMVRTYAMHKMTQAQASKKKRVYDIKATNIHQTYKGLHEAEHLQQAVEQTQGLILAYNKQPIVSMYDSCCGGVIPAHLTGFDFKKTPYLARPYACTYCSDCKLYYWKHAYTHDQLHTIMQREFPGLKQVKEIRISHRDAAGKVLEVAVKAGRDLKRISGTQMYRLCKDIKSFCYTIARNGDHVIFEGKGYGHHVGACQWGVRAMVKQGFTCKDILEYYYPGVELMKLVVTTHPHEHART